MWSRPFIEAHRTAVNQADIAGNKCSMFFELFQEKYPELFKERGVGAEDIRTRIFKFKECKCEAFMCLGCAKE